MTILHVGLDDIDTPHGGCTTHLASLIIEKLNGKVKFLDYPRLIRLNPNIPWKTRGNGAVALELNVDDVEYVKSLVVDVVKGYVEEFHHPSSQPVVVFTVGPVDEKLKWFGLKTVRDVVTLDVALKVLDMVKGEYYKFTSGSRGVIGALAAIGVTLENCDYTFEIIAYRSRSFWGKPRLVDEDSVFKMDVKTRPKTFLNVDWRFRRVLITPRGPDPILFGIRGEDPKVLVEALKMVKTYEPIDRWVIFRTNQATDMHLVEKNIGDVRVYQSVIVRGVVSKPPRVIRGGHVIFQVNDNTGSIECAVYKQTEDLNRIARELIVGDYIEVAGGIRPPSLHHGVTLNIEKLKIIKLKENIVFKNPKCPKCGATMKSQGRGKGFKCPKCKYKTTTLNKIAIKIPRKIKEGTHYPPPKTFKHLMKPPERENTQPKGKPKLIKKWHNP